LIKVAVSNHLIGVGCASIQTDHHGMDVCFDFIDEVVILMYGCTIGGDGQLHIGGQCSFLKKIKIGPTGKDIPISITKYFHRQIVFYIESKHMIQYASCISTLFVNDGLQSTGWTGKITTLVNGQHYSVGQRLGNQILCFVGQVV
tara:strand:+ start:666 stop:1100 length:435 start_codon:yes stop_codon:yes gene_type:complete